MPSHTAILSPGTTSFRIKSRVVRDYTWNSLYYDQGLIYFENLDAAKNIHYPNRSRPQRDYSQPY